MSAGDALLNATTEIASTVAAAVLNATTQTPPPPFMVMATDSHTNLAMGELSHVGDGIFLQSKTALGIAGAFVCVALFLTCQQVGGWVRGMGRCMIVMGIMGNVVLDQGNLRIHVFYENNMVSI